MNFYPNELFLQLGNVIPVLGSVLALCLIPWIFEKTDTSNFDSLMSTIILCVITGILSLIGLIAGLSNDIENDSVAVSWYMFLTVVLINTVVFTYTKTKTTTKR